MALLPISGWPPQCSPSAFPETAVKRKRRLRKHADVPTVVRFKSEPVDPRAAAVAVVVVVVVAAVAEVAVVAAGSSRTL